MFLPRPHSSYCQRRMHAANILYIHRFTRVKELEGVQWLMFCRVRTRGRRGRVLPSSAMPILLIGYIYTSASPPNCQTYACGVSTRTKRVTQTGVSRWQLRLDPFCLAVANQFTTNLVSSANRTSGSRQVA